MPSKKIPLQKSLFVVDPGFSMIQRMSPNLHTLQFVAFNPTVPDKYNITFRRNDGLAWTFNEESLTEFTIDINLLKHTLHFPSKIFCHIVPLRRTSIQENSVIEKVKEEVNCNVCLESMIYQKIYLCEEGHSPVCEECFCKLDLPRKCPMCNSQMTDNRNYRLETIRDILVPNSSGSTRDTIQNGHTIQNGRTGTTQNEGFIPARRQNFSPLDFLNYTENLGYFFIMGALERFVFINWNQNDRNKFFKILFIIIETYVLLTIKIIIFAHSKDFVFSHELFSTIILVLLFNLSVDNIARYIGQLEIRR